MMKFKTVEDHVLEQERNRAHRNIKSRIQHCAGPKPTKRRGISALRLERRLRSIETVDSYPEHQLDDVTTVNLLDVENEAIMAELETARLRSIMLFDAPEVIVLDDDASNYYCGGFHNTCEERDRLALR